jgi:hypothetical protein
MVEAVRRMDGDLTSEKLPRAVNTAAFDPGGVVLSYGSDKEPGLGPGHLHDPASRRVVQTGRGRVIKIGEQ